MASYTISGSVTVGGHPVDGEWIIRIASQDGIGFQTDGDWAAGEVRENTVDGALELELPETTINFRYSAEFRSTAFKRRRGHIRYGPFPFALTGDTTWAALIAAA